MVSQLPKFIQPGFRYFINNRTSFFNSKLNFDKLIQNLKDSILNQKPASHLRF